MIRVSWKTASVIAGRIRWLPAVDAGQPGGPGAERDHLAAAEARQPLQRHGEDEDQQDADQERRQRDADQRERHHRLGEERAAPQRRVDAHRNAEGERDQRRQQRQLEGRRQALGDRATRPCVPGAGSDRTRPARHCRRSARTGPGTGWSRPRSLRSCWRCCGVASWPRMLVTGSPTYWNSMKAMKATVSITRTACTRRRRTKASMERGGRDREASRAVAVEEGMPKAHGARRPRARLPAKRPRGARAGMKKAARRRPLSSRWQLARGERADQKKWRTPRFEALRLVAATVVRPAAPGSVRRRVVLVADQARDRGVQRGPLGQVVLRSVALSTGRRWCSSRAFAAVDRQLAAVVAERGIRLGPTARHAADRVHLLLDGSGTCPGRSSPSSFRKPKSTSRRRSGLLLRTRSTVIVLPTPV